MSKVLFPIVLALGAIILVPVAVAREPTPIKTCQTISQPGSYELANNLTTNGDCLVITASFVTIDLAGFAITGPGPTFPPLGTAIAAGDDTKGIVVRNGSISGFDAAVDLAGEGSIVEGLRVSGPCPCDFGISANGIVRGNTVFGIGTVGAGGVAMSATGIVTGNYVSNNARGFVIGQGSTVIGNTATNNLVFGISVDCPSNVTDNTVTTKFSRINLELNGEGCNNTNNVAP